MIFTLNHLSGTGNEFDKVHICDHYAYNLVSGVTKSYDVEIYYIRESDDDTPNWCQDESIANHGSLDKYCLNEIGSKHICINQGMDGTLDLELKIDEHCCDGDDVIDTKTIGGTERQFILAGPNKTCDTDVFLPNDQGENIGYSEEQIRLVFEKVNSFYNKYLINLRPKFIGEAFINYDLEEEDGILSKSEFDMIRKINVGYFTSNSVSRLFFVSGTTFGNGLESLSGFGLQDLFGNPLNICVAHSGTSLDLLPAVIAHELGHSMAGMLHYDHTEYNGVIDPPSIMRPQSIISLDIDIPNTTVLRYHDWIKFYNK